MKRNLPLDSQPFLSPNPAMTYNIVYIYIYIVGEGEKLNQTACIRYDLLKFNYEPFEWNRCQQLCVVS